MKALLSPLAVLLAASPCFAAWGDLKPGMDEKAALQCVGMPILQNRGKGGAATWTYDCGGYILLRYGRVTSWDEPDVKKPATVARSEAAPPRAAAPQAHASGKTPPASGARVASN